MDLILLAKGMSSW